VDTASKQKQAQFSGQAHPASPVENPQGKVDYSPAALENPK
jgi:hypothetical protein